MHRPMAEADGRGRGRGQKPIGRSPYNYQTIISAIKVRQKIVCKIIFFTVVCVKVNIKHYIKYVYHLENSIIYKLNC
jgi:hypothetical protein